MRSKEYWERRAAERMVNYQADAERTANEIGRAYYQSQEYIKSEINKVFSGFQKGFSLSEEEARDILDASDDATAMTVLRDAAMKIADPVERDKALAALSSPAYQYRINRLDAIKRNIAATCNSLYRTELKADSSFLSSEIVKAYQNTIFDVQKGTGVSGAFDIIPQSKIDAIMSRKWLGTRYSERIWNNTGKLAEELKGDLMAGFLTGKSEQQMTAEIAERYQTSFFNARRLVRTECTYVTGQAELHSYTEMGVEEYEFSAILDKSTSKICKRLDGKKFKVSKAKPGTNYPPMHPFCRSVANAVLPSEEELDDMWGDTADAIGADVDFDEWVKNLEKTPDGKWKYQKPKEFVEAVEPKKPAFVPAGSVEEAQAKAEAHFKEYFGDKTFKGKADFKGISLDNANDICQRLDELYDEYDIPPLAGIKAIDPNSAKGKKIFADADAVMAYSPIEHGIFINKNVLKNADTLAKYNRESEEAWNVVMNNIDTLSGSQKAMALRYKQAGRALVGDGSVGDYLQHEVGHHVQWEVLDAKTNNLIGSRMNEYASKVSGYATATKGEYIAESFSAYVKGQRSILDPKFVSFMDGKRLDNSGKSGIMELYRRDKNIGAFSELKIPMQKRAIKRVCKKYGVDISGINIKIQRSEEFLGKEIIYFGSTDYDNVGRIDLFPNAFADEEQLIRTIIHEKCHVMQIKRYGKEYAQANLNEMELQAYRFEDIFYEIVKKRV